LNLGVNMGEGHLQQKDILNERGYVEDLRWARIDKAISGQGYDAHWGTPQPAHIGAYKNLIRACAKQPIWGVKQPRLVFVFSYLVPLFEEANVDVRVVVAHRDHEATVKAYHAYTHRAYGGRWPMNEAQARAHVELFRDALNWQLERWTGPVHIVDYDTLLEQPVTELCELHDYCFEDLDIPGHKRVITPALSWLEKGLRHHVSHRADAGQGDGTENSERGFTTVWTPKRPCNRGCR